jgi:hypothetical protein
MTFLQIIHELRGLVPRDIEEWLDLRRNEIEALKADERVIVYNALADLKQWLLKLNH